MPFYTSSGYESKRTNARLTSLETPAYAYGTLGGEVANAAQKTFTEVDSKGITKTSAYIYTIVTPGIYQFYAQQLVQTGGAATYLMGYAGGSDICHAFLVASRQDDMIVSYMKQLASGDTIYLYIQGVQTACWTGNHSSYYINLIRRT